MPTLVLMSLIGVVLVGFTMGKAKSRSPLHLLSLAAAIAFSFYVIMDLNHPRSVLIRVDSADDAMRQVYALTTADSPVPATQPANQASNDVSNRSLDLTFRTKLVLSMCLLVLLTGAALIAVAERGNQASTKTLVDSLFQEVSRHAVTQTKDFVLRAAPVAESLEQLSSQGLAIDNLDRLAPQLLAFLKGNAGMTWVLYGDESGDYTGATRLPDGRIHIERTHIVNGRTHLTEYEVQSDGSWKVFRQDDNSGYDPAPGRFTFWPSREEHWPGRPRTFFSRRACRGFHA